MGHTDELLTLAEGARLLASSEVNADDMHWFDTLEVDSPTLRGLCRNMHANARTVAAELYEQRRQHKRAIDFAQAELNAFANFSLPSKVSALARSPPLSDADRPVPCSIAAL